MFSLLFKHTYREKIPFALGFHRAWFGGSSLFLEKTADQRTAKKEIEFKRKDKNHNDLCLPRLNIFLRNPFIILLIQRCFAKCESLRL
jgi:hypothetical protein